ncbi:adenosylcobinamide-GDP ribazoletransferase [Candidatus Margulisiibacteriota bacterium]
MRKLLIAIQFLTILPIGPKAPVTEKDLAQAPFYFPVVGLLIGLILTGINQLLSLFINEPLLINTLLISALVILTGGLHLDGLADTFDALLSRKSKTEMLAIMRDSQIGTMGALSLIIIILLKITMLSALPLELKNTALVLMGIISRYVIVLPMLRLPYARTEGKAKAFIDGMNPRFLATSSIITLLLVFIAGQLCGIITLSLVSILVIITSTFFARRFEGITGDVLGALAEMSEVYILFIILLLSFLR